MSSVRYPKVITFFFHKRIHGLLDMKSAQPTPRASMNARVQILMFPCSGRLWVLVTSDNIAHRTTNRLRAWEDFLRPWEGHALCSLREQIPCLKLSHVVSGPKYGCCNDTVCTNWRVVGWVMMGKLPLAVAATGQGMFKFEK